MFESPYFWSIGIPVVIGLVVLAIVFVFGSESHEEEELEDSADESSKASTRKVAQPNRPVVSPPPAKPSRSSSVGEIDLDDDDDDYETEEMLNVTASVEVSQSEVISERHSTPAEVNNFEPIRTSDSSSSSSYGGSSDSGGGGSDD